MKKPIAFTIISLCLTCAIMLGGCTQARNLGTNVQPNPVQPLGDLSAQNDKVTDFALRLYKASQEEGKNTLISPFSVLYALAMTANGAEKETLTQMEAVLGMTTRELNSYLYSYTKNLPRSEKYKLSPANSIWFTDGEDFTVNQDFLQINTDYYGADIYRAPFNDQTCKEINDWVKEKTDGMIPMILDRIPQGAIMYLINALAFEAEWSQIYREDQVWDGVFTTADGTKRDVEFMYSSESAYLDDGKATGFLKYYKDGKYAFVALLPNEGVSVSEYVASLDGASLQTLLRNPRQASVSAAIPKFETKYDVEMSELLKGMGMTEAFDDAQADFGKLGTSTVGNICISRVLHKTFISVGEKGTRAGAATAVEMKAEGAYEPQVSMEVHLDRPFVYMLVDCENNIPLFIGTMMDTEQ